jgi:hypothetical protein
VPKSWAVVLLLLISSLTFSQNRSIVLNRTKKAFTGNSSGLKYPARRDSIKILAIMVEFQIDASDLTTGDGTFQKEISTTQIDPPPHDSVYFKNKLLFVQNYFRKTSNGILNVSANLCTLPITLSKTMSEYSPPISNDDNTKLVELVTESWQKADTLFPQIDFAKYDAFVVFHAGVGRDLDLVSILGQNPAPYDIPSIYLDSAAIAGASGTTGGIPLRNNSVFIKNSIILPETESRMVPTAFGDELLQFSINGLFAASIGNFLGLPDLFDTKTGRSGIGMFGLMDGAGFFSFSGLFPPEPSAWEKIYLGWIKPVDINSSANMLELPAVSLSNLGQDTVYKIPISGSEYFLVENRSRILEGGGVDLDIADAYGNVQHRHFDRDIDGFNYFDVSEIHGSVLDISNFDWAFWGEIDGQDDFDGGGILIWHIDENIINAGLSANSVNTDINHRGVDLEEADGSQDIGRVYDFLTAGYGTESGTPYDFWFEGNRSPVYKNIFDKSSFPNSSSYTGGASLVTIKNFSRRSARMTFSVEIGDPAYLQKDSLFQRNLPESTAFPTAVQNQIFVPSTNGLFAFRNDGSCLTSDASGRIPVERNIGEVAVKSSADSVVIAGVYGDTLETVILRNPGGGGIFDSVETHVVVSGKNYTSAPSFLSDTILIGADSGIVYKYSLRGDLISSRSFGSNKICSISLLPTPDEYYCSSYDRVSSETAYADLPSSAGGWLITSAVSSEGDFVVSAEKDGNRVICFDRSLSHKLFEKDLGGSTIRDLCAGDLDGDGEKEIIIQTSDKIFALNRMGSLLSGFPVKAAGGKMFSGTLLIADFDGNASQDIATFTTDGELWIYNSKGALRPGYPVQLTAPGDIYPVIYKTADNMIGIMAVSSNDSLYAVRIPVPFVQGAITWGQHLADSHHSNSQLMLSVFVPRIQNFLPVSTVYNWPNPVYGTSTQIRYYTSEDAEMTVTIFDISGVKITELKGKGNKGLDGELTWDVSNIQSGVYIARVEARGASKTEAVFIKIAVIK